MPSHRRVAGLGHREVVSEMVYVGVSGRFLVNLEALNMAESVGNVVKHKRAPIVLKTEDGFSVHFVPVISGASIAHGYQEILAKIAKEMGLPVCSLCEKGIFLKHSSEELLKSDRLDREHRERLLSLQKDIHAFEKEVISSCVVEDVGGFLYPGVTPVKRTSRFLVGYMIPSLAHPEAYASEALFHVRYDPESPAGGRASEQAIYYVETGSALYVLNMALDVDGIGRTSAIKVETLGDRDKRVEAALKALAILVSNLEFGAKRSRFLPQWTVESLVVTASRKYSFNPVPGHFDNYIELTKKFADSHMRVLEDEVALAAYVSEDASAKSLEGVTKDTPMEALEAVFETLRGW